MPTKDSFSSFVRSRLFAGIVVGVGTMLIIVCVFEAGVAVGYHEAVFSSHWGENYERNFGGDGMQGLMGLPDGHEPQPHGTTGQIISISGSTFVVENDNRQEEKVVIASDTTIRNQENTMNASSLSVGDTVVVVGNPDNQGDIDASLIRIIPTPPSNTLGSTSPSSP